MRHPARRGRRVLALAVTTACAVMAITSGAAASPGAAAKDWDGDGVLAPSDCAPLDPAVHPGAPDKPDMAFEDTNCDGIDGDVNKAIFVDGGAGLDTRSGVKDFPKKTIAAAIVAAKAAAKDVYVASGTYSESLTLDTNVSIYGGYTPTFSVRTTAEPTTVTGAPHAALADGKTGISLQLLSLVGGSVTTVTGGSSYGLRVLNGAKVQLERVTATGGAAGPGATGGGGATGLAGGDGSTGTNGACGGASGTGPAGGTGANAGGKGGNGGGAGGDGIKGGDGGPFGSIGTGGGFGGGATGSGNRTGGDGTRGNAGNAGPTGNNGTVPLFTLDAATTNWNGNNGNAGNPGGSGTGGGGGGGGGGASITAIAYSAGGGAGGSGGAGGGGGEGGKAGGAGGGSFGVYVYNALVVARNSTLRGGAGGSGGDGGRGGDPGAPGDGGAAGSGASGGVGTGCGDGLAFNAKGGAGGKGGDGGKGGTGGAGSGGTGGPSAGVFRGGLGSFYSQRNTTQAGGPGGTGGRVGAGNGPVSPTGMTGGLLQATGIGSAAGDFDNDGVTDPLDDCPTVTAAGTTNGCPARPAKLVDTDQDGTPDTDAQGNPADKCPAVAPAPGTDADDDGCADPMATPTPTPTPTVVATPIQPSSGNNTPPTSAGTAPAAVEQVVITLSYFADAGAKASRFKSLKIRNVPLGATATVTCKGAGCPSGLKGKGFTKTNAFGAIDLKQFIKKPLKAGVTITVIVSKPNAISAVKILKVRKAKAPSITTRCIRPGTTQQVACA